MVPAWREGAEADAENFESLAALTAKALRQPSLAEHESSTLAASTVPEGSTEINTVTSPAPMHLYAGIGSLLAFLPSRDQESTEGPEYCCTGSAFFVSCFLSGREA